MKKARIEVPEPIAVCTNCDEETFDCDGCGDMWEDLVDESETVYCDEKWKRHYCIQCKKDILKLRKKECSDSPRGHHMFNVPHSCERKHCNFCGICQVVNHGCYETVTAASESAYNKPYTKVLEKE